MPLLRRQKGRIEKPLEHFQEGQSCPSPCHGGAAPPRYLFIGLDLARDRWRSINGTFGVDRLLMRGGAPEPVPSGVVERLIEASETGGIVRLTPLHEGQTIRVTAGPFVELLGHLEQLDDAGRVGALLEIMGGQVPILLRDSFVAAV